jgi:diguanylate cyclase (GGDEF)-like protein
VQFIVVAISRALERQALSRHNSRLLNDLQAANNELELRRRQQLQYISYLGRALSGALNYRDVVQVLIQAALESINCDGAGVLLVRRNGLERPWVMTAGRKALSPGARDALIAAMATRLPAGVTFDQGGAESEELSVAEASEIDDGPWRRFAFGLLAVRDEFDGVAVLASHSEQPFAEEAQGFFEILVTQGSVALANARLFARTNELATRDGLTGIYNHRHFFELLEAEISRAERHNQELAVAMLDVDCGRNTGLKAINDTYGHQAGDAALKAVASFLQLNVRRADVVARYGGDEFIVLAPQTGQEDTLVLANRLCALLRETPFSAGGHEVHLTVSIGAAVFRPGRGDNANTVVNLADRGVYLAKERGGDQVCMVDAEEG